MTTNPELLARLWALRELNVSAEFLRFIEASLLTKKCSEKQVLDYCVEKEILAETSNYAKPKHGFSSVSSRRSNKHNQFWYK